MSVNKGTASKILSQAFLDDNKELISSKNPIHTEKVKSLLLGSTQKLETILKIKAVDNIIIALPMNNVSKIIHIFNLCERYGVKTELIPRYFKIISDEELLTRTRSENRILLTRDKKLHQQAIREELHSV